MTPVTPRRIEFEELITVLISEHIEIKKKLADIKQSVSCRDFSTAAKSLGQLDLLFRQHIADEEAQVLGLLIRTLGVKGAEAEIQVFRQHRPIYQLMQKVGELAGMSAGELESKQAELDALFEAHTKAEEERVFPKAKAMNEQN